MNSNSTESPKILIAGVGGVGGMLGGMLGRKYDESLTLLAHGRRRDMLEKNGLVLRSEFYGDSVSRPLLITDTCEGVPVQDYVFVCVKNYSLDEIVEIIRPVVGHDTVVCAIMNGVEPGEKLREVFDDAIVIDGLIYTVSSAETDCSIKQIGQYTHTFIGSAVRDERHIDGAKRLDALLKSVEFDSRYADDVQREIWRKFILNCGFNSITGRYIATSGIIRKNEIMKQDTLKLMQEAQAVGLASKINLDLDTAEKQYEYVMFNQPDGATSSLRRDLEGKRRTEVDAFLGAVQRKGIAFGIPTPVTDKYLKEILEMSDKYLKNN